MRKDCEIMVTEYDRGQVVAGTITLENGKLRTKANKGFEKIMKDIRFEIFHIKDKEYDPKEDPKDWFEHLGVYYSGAALRAKYVDR